MMQVKKLKTNMNLNPAKDAVLRFVRVAGAGVIALLIGLISPIGTPVALLVVALLVALDKYLRDIKAYETAKEKVTAILKK